MPDDSHEKILGQVVNELCEAGSYKTVYHRTNHDTPMPSIEDLEDLVELLREVLFPGYFGNADIRPETMHYYIGTSLDRAFRLLAEQAKRGYCFDCGQYQRKEWKESSCVDCDAMARAKAGEFIKRLPRIRALLASDVLAAYEGDPASKSYGETIFCYPSIFALTNHRIAHELISLGVPLIPRIISEMAHSRTGIDIHPGADIGERFFIDHGSGTVIGETCVIGRNVRLYQGVTLGAKSFPMDKDGNPIKGIARHPIVKDNVIVYSGATILGRITIGEGSTIGGNVWLTHSVPPNSHIMQSKAVDASFESGAGI